DLQTDFMADEAPAAQVDGGMVLLQSSGDVNESGFDLTPVYARQFEPFVAPAMETSVGLYQAVDVATDELPAVEVHSAPSARESLPNNQTDESLPAPRQQSSSRKAASLIGVTTLTGAMVWMSRARSDAEKARSTAQKRRGFRS